MSANRLKYLVVAPSFSPDVGGIIFQHELVHALNSLGEEAYLWPQGPTYKQGRRERLRRWLRPENLDINPELNTPIAQKSDLGDNAVVVYSEIVLGNPLGVKNVVRWLLYKPGLRHPYDFTENEMYFRDFEKADLPEVTGGAPDLFLWKINRTYRNENRTGRKGACYALRKGDYKPRIPQTETPDAVLIDGLSHAEINGIFNRCEVFYSYDEATMYSQYAAICGCQSVVIPGEHADRADWAGHHDLCRYGVAYGLDDLDHARTTRKDLLIALAQKERDGIETVKRFIALTRERFLTG